MTTNFTKPLSGIRVLDFSSMMAGPYCGRWLADLGADVIKVEPPEGDYMRTRPPLRDGYSAYFGHLNCGKRSIVLDLKNPDALAVARRLVEQCDVLIENFRPGVMERLGLAYDMLGGRCTRLIYCSISGYGQAGPKAQDPAYAAIVHAASGFDDAWQSAQPSNERPPTCGIQIADVVAASFAAMAIQSALLVRAASGTGQKIDVSLAEGMLALMPIDIVNAQFPGDTRLTHYRPIAASDGYFVVVPLSQKNFVSLSKAMARDELVSDIRFSSPSSRIANWSALLAEIEAWAVTLSASECVARLTDAGVPASLYKSVVSNLTDPQLVSRRFFMEAQDAAGAFKVAGLPFSLNEEASHPAGPVWVPELGAHSYEILQELLGLGAAELELLASKGVFGARFDKLTQLTT